MPRIATAIAAAAAMAAAASAPGPVFAASAGGPPPVLDFISLTPWYWAASLGVALPGQINLTAVETSSFGLPTLSGRARFNAGPAASVSIGKYFATNFRGELRGSFTYDTARSFSGAYSDATPLSAAMSGSVSTFSIVGFGFYEVTGLGKLVPFFGGGVGVADVVANNLHIDTTAGFTNGNSVVPVVAASLGLGWRINLSTEATFAYNAMVGTDAKLTYSDPGSGVARAVSADVRGHSFTGGVKVKF